MLGPLDVIWIHDDTIRPPGPKMVACVEADLGLFFRINTKDNYQYPVELKKLPYHVFLSHDSFLECGEPLELDEYVVGQSIEGRGIIGTLSTTLVTDILGHVWAAKQIAEVDKKAIESFLRPIDLTRLNRSE